MAARLVNDRNKLRVEHGPCGVGECKDTVCILDGAVYDHSAFLHFEFLLTFKDTPKDRPAELVKYLSYVKPGSGKREEAKVFTFFQKRMDHYRAAYMIRPQVGTHDTLTTRATTLI
jgi:hypothetical protein